jgi:FkbM family methyltransferase
MLLDLDETYNRFLFYRGTQAIEEYGPFCEIIRPGMTVLDVGANIGVFTLAAARLVGPTGRVIAFEPLPRNHRFLMANLALNGYSHVTVERMAVGNRDEPLTINLFGTDNLSFSDTVVRGQKATCEVQCCRLDTYLRKHGIDHVDVMKIDIEGAEDFAIEGMSDLFAGGCFPRVIMEVHPEFLASLGRNARSVLTRLHEAGYVMDVLESESGPRVRIGDIHSFQNPNDYKYRISAAV